jgi:hypothetical protein
MFRVLSVVLLGLALWPFSSNEIAAQQFAETGVVYEAGRNKIGLILHCRNNALLDPPIANQAVTAVETGLSKLPLGDPLTREQGDRAQQAGEAGYWEAGRRRDIAGVAKLFGTTPADLCKEWAAETLRAQAPRPRGEITTVAAVAPIQPVQPFPQTEATPVQPTQADRSATRGATVNEAPSAAPPPLPEKAPSLPRGSELASLPRTLPTSGDLASTGAAVSGLKSGATATTPAAKRRSLGQAVPSSARLASGAPGPLRREQTITAAAPSRRLDDPSPQHSEKPRFTCFMPGCKWPTSQDSRSWQY